jgi:hypothetical protein
LVPAAPLATSSYLTFILVLVSVLYAGAQALMMGTGACRLAGVRTKRVATGLTLFNLFATTGRLLSLFYQPFIGVLVDNAKNAHDPAQFEWYARIIMAAATIGAVLGGVLTPTATRLLQRGIVSFERRGSLLQALAQLGRPTVMLSALGEFSVPQPSALRYSPRNLPKAFLWWNVVVMAFWLAGPLSAAEAAVLSPKFAVTAVYLSGLITGVSTLTLTLIVDPTAALVTDQAAVGMRPEYDVKAMLLYLIISGIVGTLLSQILLYPAAHLIAWAAQLLNAHGLHHA